MSLEVSGEEVRLYSRFGMCFFFLSHCLSSAWGRDLRCGLVFGSGPARAHVPLFVHGTRSPEDEGIANQAIGEIDSDDL